MPAHTGLRTRLGAGAAATTLALSGLAILTPTTAGAATTYDVTSLVDGAPGSLRAVLTAANGDTDASEINLPADADIRLDVCGPVFDEDGNAEGDLDHTSDQALTIDGNGATITQTCASQRVLHLTGTGATQLWDVTITGGDVTTGIGGGNGGGIYLQNDGGSLLVARSSIVGNSAANAGGGISAPVLGSSSPSALSVFDSTIADNSSEFGGGVFYGGALIVNSTISGNTVLDNAGAVAGARQLIYVTITGNQAGSEPGFRGQITSDPAIWGSVIGASSDGGPNCSAFAPLSSSGYNVEDGDDCGLDQSTDLVDTDPMLETLSDNGGPTQTHLPAPSSPLLDHIATADCNPTYVADQRNVSRPQGTGCDTGSVEVEVDAPPAPEPTPEPPAPDAPATPGTPAARAAAVATNPRFTG
jgi:hypothetical protein